VCPTNGLNLVSTNYVFAHALNVLNEPLFKCLAEATDAVTDGELLDNSDQPEVCHPFLSSPRSQVTHNLESASSLPLRIQT
jgi:hypothetical protein